MLCMMTSLSPIDRLLTVLVCFPYHSSVVQGTLDAFASGALFGFPSGASGIISLCCHLVNRFFLLFWIFAKIAFVYRHVKLRCILLLLTPLTFQVIFQMNDCILLLARCLFATIPIVLFQIIAYHQRQANTTGN